MIKKSLRVFKPEIVAKIETDMWHSYYAHRFFTLFRLFLKLIREQFGVNFFVAFRAAYFGIRAAVEFRTHKKTQTENQNTIELRLIKFWKVISDNATEPYDYVAAGKAEALWWFVDRYPERYTMTREEGIRNAMAIVFNVAPESLSEYAEIRSRAAVLLDGLKNVQADGDWAEVQELLTRAYRSLYQVVGLNKERGVKVYYEGKRTKVK